MSKERNSLVRGAMTWMVVVFCIVCNWALAVFLRPMSSTVGFQQEALDFCVVEQPGEVARAALQGETVSAPLCCSHESGSHSISIPKKLRSHVPGERVSAFCTYRLQNFYFHPSLFSKAGTAFVSSRASNYYVYALRHLLC